MYSQGPPEGPPVVMPGRQLYDHAGTQLAIAVLAALRARPAAGGQFIEISAQGAGDLPGRLHRYTNAEDITRRSDDYPAVGGIWPCRDGVIEFIALTDKHWASLLQLLGSRPNSAIPLANRLAGGSTPRKS